MGLLLIVRHGQASFGASDYDRLSDLGRRQARLTAEALTAARGPVTRVICGSLRRQHDTAEAIAAAWGLPVTRDARWDEYLADPILAHHSGTDQRLEHPAGAAAAPSDPRAFQSMLEGALRSWMAAGRRTRADESWPAFDGRVAAALADAGDAAAAARTTTVVVSSAGTIAALCARLLGTEPADPAAFLALNRVAVNCGITRVVAGASGTTLVAFNEQQHLPREALTYR